HYVSPVVLVSLHPSLFNDPPTPDLSTLSLHDALPICRTDNLARDGARSGCCPEWHAPDNEGERGHHEGPEPKPRSVQGGVDQRPAAFVLLFGERDDQN